MVTNVHIKLDIYDTIRVTTIWPKKNSSEQKTGHKWNIHLGYKQIKYLYTFVHSITGIGSDLLIIRDPKQIMHMPKHAEQLGISLYWSLPELLIGVAATDLSTMHHLLSSDTWDPFYYRTLIEIMTWINHYIRILYWMQLLVHA